MKAERDNLTKQYPRWRWPQHLKDAVDRQVRARRWTAPFTWPLDAAAERIEREYSKTAWGEDHYQDWERDELIWRVVFLQDAGRASWARYVVMVRWVVPLALLAGAVIGRLVLR